MFMFVAKRLEGTVTLGLRGLSGGGGGCERGPEGGEGGCRVFGAKSFFEHTPPPNLQFEHTHFVCFRRNDNKKLRPLVVSLFSPPENNKCPVTPRLPGIILLLLFLLRSLSLTVPTEKISIKNTE